MKDSFINEGQLLDNYPAANEEPQHAARIQATSHIATNVPPHRRRAQSHSLHATAGTRLTRMHGPTSTARTSHAVLRMPTLPS